MHHRLIICELLKNKKASNLIQVYLTNTEKKLVDLFCKKNNLSKLSAVREIIRTFF